MEAAHKACVYSVTMDVHARSGAAHLTHCMWRKHTCMLSGHFGQGGFFSFFLRSRQPAENGYGGAWLALSCALWITGARTGGEPLGAHWDHRAVARDTAGGPGRHTNTGHGVRSHRSGRCGSFLERREAGVGGSGAEQAGK